MSRPTVTISHEYCYYWLKSKGWETGFSRAGGGTWTDPKTKLPISIETAMEIQLEREYQK